MKTLKRRTMEKVLLQASKAFPAILVTGPRQVGKSTLLQMASRKSPRRYVSLDDFAELQQAKKTLDFFWRSMAGLLSSMKFSMRLSF